MTGFHKGLSESTTHTSQVVATWQLLDSGERQWSYRASKYSSDAERLSYLNTLRSTLFLVHEQYYNTLRAQELLRISEAQVTRAEKVADKTKEFERIGQGARLDISQAEADYLNAQVTMLQSKNKVSTNEAGLKAVIGWDKSDKLPKLVTYPEPSEFVKPGDLEDVIRDGLKHRPDLEATRKNLQAQRFNVLTAQQNSFLTWSLDATYSRQFSENAIENQGLTFLVSMPLFDGNRSRESAKEAKFSYEASKSTLVQSERSARSEIESAYLSIKEVADRVTASKKALDAAQKNYDAVNDSFNLGAETSTLIEVLTAQVTLRTAESNYVEAIYDYYIADIQLRLVTGQAIPGETN
jgi:outer membrane protein TolC